MRPRALPPLLLALACAGCAARPAPTGHAVVITAPPPAPARTAGPGETASMFLRLYAAASARPLRRRERVSLRVVAASAVSAPLLSQPPDAPVRLAEIGAPRLSAEGVDVIGATATLETPALELPVRFTLGLYPDGHWRVTSFVPQEPHMRPKPAQK